MTVRETPTDSHDPSTTAEPAVPAPSPGPAGRWLRNLGLGALVIAILGTSFWLGRASVDLQEPALAVATTEATAPPATLPAGAEPVAAVAAALAPSMVQIQADRGLGSGVIYDADGLILTSAHVVDNARRVVVQLADGSRVEGTVVGADRASDVAVVRVDAPNLQPAPLALDEELFPGQMAIAIGSPFGLDQTVTAGVISNVSRAVPGSDGIVRELIQTDAPINPGNSGGALADRQGRVIGINDQIFSTSGGNEGVGFAIPIANAKAVADKLVAGEPVGTPVLGVTGNDPVLGQAGALITSIQRGSAADEAGIRSGDLIVAVDESPIQSFTDLAAAVRAHQPGDTIRLSIQRAGQDVQLDVVLGTR